MRTRSGSDYKLVDRQVQLSIQCTAGSPTRCAESDVTTPMMEMDALENAITSLDMVGPVTNEAIAQLLRGLATTITKSVKEICNRKKGRRNRLG